MTVNDSEMCMRWKDEHTHTHTHTHTRINEPPCRANIHERTSATLTAYSDSNRHRSTVAYLAMLLSPHYFYPTHPQWRNRPVNRGPRTLIRPPTSASQSVQPASSVVFSWYERQADGGCLDDGRCIRGTVTWSCSHVVCGKNVTRSSSVWSPATMTSFHSLSIGCGWSKACRSVQSFN